MSLVSKSIPNLINGVSQQPAEVRLASQCDEQVNWLSSVVEGLKRRPGTRHIAKLLTTSGSGAYVHIINRDRFEKYLLVIIDGTARVFDFQGNEKVVNAPKGFNYLTSFSASKAIRAVTVADYTFILNRERVARAYDPSAGLTLTPITKRFQILRFTDLSSPGPTYPRFKAGEEGTYKTCWGAYSVTIAGRTYTRSAELGASQAFASYLAARLFTDLQRGVINMGAQVLIPLDDGQAPYSVADNCRNGTHTTGYWPLPDIFVGPSAGYYQHQLCTTVPYSCLTWIIETRTVGYESSDGDLIPEAEVAIKEGLVYVRLGDYGSSYRILVNGAIKASITTGTSDRASIGTNVIASNLYSQLSAAGLTNLVITLKGSSILLRSKTNDVDFTLSVEDSNNGNNLVACKGKIQAFTDLPAVGFEGFSIKVAGQNGVEADDYYVQYSELNKDGEKTTGSWKEVAKKGLRTRPAPDTMPHRLISEGDGSFTFEPIEWDGRVAGDEVTAPEASFINKTLADIFFFKNRLGFLSDENVIFSEDGSYYNFYPSTVLQSLDTHPIDVAVTNDKVSILRHAVPFNETLLLFSDQTQFILSSNDKLTRETVNIDVTTRFEAALDAKPVGAGKNVFFGVRHGPYASLREYYVDPDAKVNDAADVGSHCPEYLSGNVIQLAASSNEDMALVLTDTAPTSLYAYKFYWQGTEKVQSAWGRWDFGGIVLGFAFMDSTIAVVIERGGEVFLEMLYLTPDGEEKGRGFKTLLNLDRLAYVRATTATPWTDPDMVAVDQKGNVYTGDNLAKVITAGTALVDLFIGLRYRSYYQFSPLVLANAETRVAPLVGRLQLRFMTLSYVNTGYFKVGVKVGIRDPQMAKYTGRRLGSDANRLGQVPLDTGRYRFPILGTAKDTKIWIESSSHLPCAFQSAEWEAMYHRVSRQV